jgi:flagellar assembly protein FliH
MAFVKLISFDRPLAGAAVPGRPGPMLSEGEVAGRLQAAFHAGSDAARAAADQQMVEFRVDMEQLAQATLAKVSGVEALLLAQLRDALPALALDIARRLLADFEPPPEVIERFWREALEQLYPERDGLELALCPRDTELLEKLAPEWRHDYPDLRLRADPSLERGDCLVRSRFGLIDARQRTKLQTLEHALVGA